MGDFRSDDPYLQKRYGITRSGLPKWIPLAISLLIAGIAWTIWSGSNHSNPEIRYNLISFKPVDAKAIEIRFIVNFKSISKEHNCTLVARDYQANVVGQMSFEFPTGISSQDVTTLIPTRAKAVNAGIIACQVR